MNKSIIGLTFVSLSLLLPTAEAATVTYSADYAIGEDLGPWNTWQSGETVNYYTSPYKSYYIPQFDPSKGSLLSVDVSLSTRDLYYNASAVFSDNEFLGNLQELPPYTSGVVSMTDFQFDAELGDFQVIQRLPDTSQSCEENNFWDNTPTCSAATNGGYAAGGMGAIFRKVPFSNPSMMDYVTGTGDVRLTASLQGFMHIDETDGGGGNIDRWWLRYWASGTVNVTYNYIAAPTLVPAPPAAWLFVSGLLGLVGVATSKRRS